MVEYAMSSSDQLNTHTCPTHHSLVSDAAFGACLWLLQSEGSHSEGRGRGRGGAWACGLVYEVCQAQHSSVEGAFQGCQLRR